jgi:two-component system, OmpR family, alkaline phosphatase synthesis response regulator PhoP
MSQGKGRVPPPHTKLLVVEDEPDIANALATYAKAKGYVPIVAQNGLLAVDIAKAERPQVILLDISLPGMDGRDVYVALEKAGVTQGAVVIFTTARDSQSDRILGLELGAADYETKPLHLQVLFQKIERLLDKKHAGEI